jgi:hypothetical protein
VKANVATWHLRLRRAHWQIERCCIPGQSVSTARSGPNKPLRWRAKSGTQRCWPAHSPRAVSSPATRARMGSRGAATADGLGPVQDL